MVQTELASDSTKHRDADDPALSANDDEGYDVRLQDWIARIVNQDQDAFAALYRETLARVYSLTLRITGDSAMAEEATEDTFWQIWRQAPRFDQTRGKPMAWIFIIARTRALDLRRSRGGDDRDQDFEMPDWPNAGHEASPLNSVVSQQNRFLLQQALAELTPAQRQLLALAFYRGLSHDEISRTTALPLGTVKATLRRTLLKLRELMAGRLGELTYLSNDED